MGHMSHQGILVVVQRLKGLNQYGI